MVFLPNTTASPGDVARTLRESRESRSMRHADKLGSVQVDVKMNDSNWMKCTTVLGAEFQNTNTRY